MSISNKKNSEALHYIFDELLKKGGLDGYDQFIAEDIQVYCPPGWEEIHPHQITTREKSKEIDQEYTKAFQNTRIEKCEVLTAQKKIIVRWKAHGYHLGDFFTMKATNKSYQVTGQTIFGFNTTNQINEVWQAWDMLGLLKQIGCIVRPAQITAIDLEKLKKLASSLSKRERDCLKSILEGLTAKETAAKLWISFRTVEYYIENLKDKLDCLDKKDLFTLARMLEVHNLI